MITILIADGHAIVRRGLKALLMSDPEIEVIGEAENGFNVVELARDLQPDIILMEIVMPGQGGLEAMEQIKAHNPEARVLVLTSYGDNERVLAAVRGGASGYLLKDASSEQLLQAVHDISNGHSHMHPTLALKMLRDLDHPPKNSTNRRVNDEPLTDRENEVLRLVAQGYSNGDIAQTLKISDRTVGNHIGSILRKLGLSNRTQAALYALRRGLVDLQGIEAHALDQGAIDEIQIISEQ
jgi:two-component system, NarL family, response regulator LiaR